MTLEELIKSLILEGKSNSEIVAAVLAHEEVKTKKIGADQIADMVHAMKKNEEITALLAQKEKADEDAKKAKADELEFEKLLDEKLDDKLKSIQVNPMGQKYGQKITKQWDHSKKDFISVDDSQFSEAHKTTNNLLIAIASKDNASAFKISSEIDSDNAKYGIKATVRSDSNSVGGYSVPTEVEGRINQMSYQQSVVLPLAYTDTITVEGKVYPTIGAVNMTDIADQDTGITESNPTFYNPTIEMKRAGLYTRVSNTILNQKGADLTTAFQVAYASGRARYIDTRTIVGNISGAGNSQDGLVWLGVQESSPVAIGAITIDTLMSMVENMNQEVDWAKVCWMMNQKMYNRIGKLESTGGDPLFKEFFSGGTFKPLGYDIVRNVRIPNTLQVGEDNSSGGSDSAIILADFSKFIIGIEGGIRIRATQDEAPLKDQTTFIGVERFGWDVLFDNTSASGGIARIQEITGANS